MSAGARFRAALQAESPLQIVGTINAFTALLAERAGHKAIYLSGAGVANASHGLPDLAMTTLNDVVEDVRRICSATDLPLLVDIDTGWGSAFMIGRTVREMTWSGAAAVHLEDQVAVTRVRQTFRNHQQRGRRAPWLPRHETRVPRGRPTGAFRATGGISATAPSAVPVSSARNRPSATARACSPG